MVTDDRETVGRKSREVFRGTDCPGMKANKKPPALLVVLI